MKKAHAQHGLQSRKKDSTGLLCGVAALPRYFLSLG